MYDSAMTALPEAPETSHFRFSLPSTWSTWRPYKERKSASHPPYFPFPARLSYLSGHDGSNTVMKNHARHSTDQKQRSASDAIDERQNAACGDQEDNVLDRGRIEVGVSSLFSSKSASSSPCIIMLGTGDPRLHCYSPNQPSKKRKQRNTWYTISLSLNRLRTRRKY
jgi:hypothetical protein